MIRALTHSQNVPAKACTFIKENAKGTGGKHFVKMTGCALVCALAIIGLACLPFLCVEASVRLYTKYKISQCVTNKPKLLFFAGAGDPLLKADPLCLTLNHTERRLMQEFAVEKCEVSTIEDVNKHLKAAKNKNTSAVWFSVHANNQTIALDPRKENGLITSRNITQLDFSKVNPNAPIIINGCEAGKQEQGVLCIAERMAQVAKGHRVYAPAEDVFGFCTALVSKPNEPSLQVQWRRFRFFKRDSSVLDIVLSPCGSVVLAMLPRFLRLHPSVTEDLTRSYQFA